MRSILRLPCKALLLDLLEDSRLASFAALLASSLDLCKAPLKKSTSRVFSAIAASSDGFPCGEPMRACWAVTLLVWFNHLQLPAPLVEAPRSYPSSRANSPTSSQVSMRRLPMGVPLLVSLVCFVRYFKGSLQPAIWSSQLICSSKKAAPRSAPQDRPANTRETDPKRHTSARAVWRLAKMS